KFNSAGSMDDVYIELKRASPTDSSSFDGARLRNLSPNHSKKPSGSASFVRSDFQLSPDLLARLKASWSTGSVWSLQPVACPNNPAIGTPLRRASPRMSSP